MSDSFDLLDQLGEGDKVKSLQAKLEKKKQSNIISQIDKIESEIDKAVEEGRDHEEIVSGIINSNFESLDGNVNETEEDLQELMLHLRGMLDSCGGEFSKLQELNSEEKTWIETAKRKLAKSERDLADAEGMSDGWNILFGMKNSKVKSMTEALTASKTNVTETETKANKSYRSRLRNADIGESLNRVISQVQGMVAIIEDLILDVEKQIEALKTRKELAFDTKEKAAVVMRDRKKELEDLEEVLKNAENELEELPNNSPEYTEQQKKIADLRESRATVKGKYNIALGIFQSKERFVDQIVIHLEAQTTTKNNLKQLIGQLKSDTEERVTTYESGLQLIQTATAQEAASLYEQAGVKTDQKITEIAAKVLVASEKDRVERVQKHPERMTELHKVLVAMAQATAKYKAEDAKIMDEHAKKFGLDVSQTFSHRHEGASNDSPSAPAPEATKKADPVSSVDGLMD